MEDSQKADRPGSIPPADLPASSPSPAEGNLSQAVGDRAAAAPSAGASRRLMMVAAGLIVLAALAAYHNSFVGTFAYDDAYAIVENRTIRHLWPVWSALCPPPNGETVSGRPLLNLSLAINYAVSGLEVWSYHAVNLLIHVAAALLLFGILRRTFLAPALRDRFGGAAGPLALASALIWAVHPLQTESVTYIAQRAESLAGCLYLLTLYCVIRGAGDEGARNLRSGVRSPSLATSPLSQREMSWPAVSWYAAAVLACLLGMACKEVMVTAPLIVLLYDRTFLAGSFLQAWRRRWGLYVGLAATWALLAYLVFSTGLIARQSALGAPDVWGYARSQPGVILHYLRLSFWPSSLCMNYSWPVANTVGEILPGAILVGLLLAATVWGLLHRKAWSFLGVWFFLILAPTSSILPLNQLAHEHRMYLSLAAVVVLAVVGGYALGERLLPRPATSSPGATVVRWAAPVAVLAAVLTALGSATVVRNRAFRSSVAIWQDAVDKLPQSFFTHYSLGTALAVEGRTGEAIDQFNQALRLKPDYAQTHNNLGLVLAATGRLSEAIEQYYVALRLKADDPMAHNNLGIALAKIGRTNEAIKHYDATLRLKPDDPLAHNNLGIALAKVGKTNKAIEEFEQALRLEPEYAEAHNNLAAVLADLGRTNEAFEHYQQAVRLKPGYVEARYNLGNALAKMGKTKEAIEHLQQAVQGKPDFALAHYTLGNLLARLGMTEEAIAHYRQFLRLKPDHVEILNNLAWLLATRAPAEGGDPARAVRLAQRARELSGNENAPCLDTLAAAYAAAGRFSDAALTAERALQLAESSEEAALAEHIHSRLELYRAGRPYREASRAPGQPNP